MALDRGVPGAALRALRTIVLLIPFASPYVPAAAAGGAAAPVAVTDLRCEHLKDPLGIDAARPRLSWVLESARRGERQTASPSV